MTNTSLDKLIALEKNTREYGFEWPHINMILDQVHSECDEIHEAISLCESKARIQEEIGDLIHTSLSLCLFAGFNVDETLDKAYEKFARRMNMLKALAKAKGLDNLKGKTTEELWSFWKEVKHLEKIQNKDISNNAEQT